MFGRSRPAFFNSETSFSPPYDVSSHPSGIARVLWSPSALQKDSILVATSSIRLLERDRESGFEVLGSFSCDLQSGGEIRCVDWRNCTKEAFGVGTESGKALFLSYKEDSRKFVVEREFCPRYSRRCNAIAFNPSKPHQVVVGLDKVRNANSALVWDVQHQGAQMTENLSAAEQERKMESFSGLRRNSFSISDLDSHVSVHEPFVQFSHSEAVNCLSWIPSLPSCIVTGAGFKWIRVYDIRSPSEAFLLGTHPKSVRAVACSPLSSFQIASMSEDGVVKIWDFRKNLSMSRSRDSFSSVDQGASSSELFSMDYGVSNLLSHIEWCPTKSDVLAISSSTNNNLLLVDVLGMKHEKITHSRKICSEGISSFAWSPHYPGHILALGVDQIINESMIYDSIPSSWNPNSSVAFGFTENDLKSQIPCNSDGDSTQVEVISIISRANAGYSLSPSENCKALINSSELLKLWTWLHHAMEVWPDQEKKSRSGLSVNYIQMRTGNVRNSSTSHIPLSHVQRAGIYSLISASSTQSKEHRYSSFGKTYYESNERYFALRLLEWASIEELDENILQKVLSRGEVERATFLAIMHMDLSLAIKCLTSDQAKQKMPQTCGLLAMALTASVGIEDKALWITTCNSIRSQFNNAYIKGILAFLCGSMSGDSSDFLLNQDLDIKDKLAYACRFYADDELKEFLSKVLQNCIEDGDLGGLYLTGFSQSTVSVLEAYLLRTDDIQTVALLSCYLRNSCPDLGEHASSVENWIQTYRDLLDRLSLWEARSKFDHDRKSMFPAVDCEDSSILGSVYPRCGFCSAALIEIKSGAPGSSTQSRPLMSAASRVLGPPSSSQITSLPSKSSFCPNCKRPLPRCSVCLLPVTCTTPNPSTRAVQGLAKEDTRASTDFNEWIVWCQSCRHGGHSGHLSEWFSIHSECPVPDCPCLCGLY